MNIAHTEMLRKYFKNDEAKLGEFIRNFRQWKTDGEFSHYYFGKDGYYSPIKAGLKHVHLVPILNLSDKIRWNDNWQKGKRRTSDTCLVYVEDGQDYLLITILPEPMAHLVAARQDEKYRVAMDFFWQIADQFFYYRNIIA